MNNTKTKGVLHYIIYKDGGDFTAVCLNLNIVEHGEDPEKLKKSIEEAALSYLNAVRKKKLSDDYLNQIPEKKYLEKLNEIQLNNELLGKFSKNKAISISLSKSKIPSYYDIKSRPYSRNNFASA